jgi:hypothetical protein
MRSTDVCSGLGSGPEQDSQNDWHVAISLDAGCKHMLDEKAKGNVAWRRITDASCIPNKRVNPLMWPFDVPGKSWSAVDGKYPSDSSRDAKAWPYNHKDLHTFVANAQKESPTYDWSDGILHDNPAPKEAEEEEEEEPDEQDEAAQPKEEAAAEPEDEAAAEPEGEAAAEPEGEAAAEPEGEAAAEPEGEAAAEPEGEAAAEPEGEAAAEPEDEAAADPQDEAAEPESGEAAQPKDEAAQPKPKAEVAAKPSTVGAQNGSVETAEPEEEMKTVYAPKADEAAAEAVPQIQIAPDHADPRDVAAGNAA